MAKSIRSKREKRLRAVRRDLVEPIYEKKDAAKLAAAEAALAAPKLPVKPIPSADADASATASLTAMEVEMADGNQSSKFLKPLGKKLKKKIKIAKKNYRGSFGEAAGERCGPNGSFQVPGVGEFSFGEGSGLLE